MSDAEGQSTEYSSQIAVNNIAGNYSTNPGSAGGPPAGSLLAGPYPSLSPVAVTTSGLTTSTAGAAPPIFTIATVTANLDEEASISNSDSLSYTWAAVSLSEGAAGVTFSTSNPSSTNQTVATFASAGNYRITVTVTDTANGLASTKVVDIVVTQKSTGINVTAADSGDIYLAAGGSEAFYADAVDQFGNSMDGSRRSRGAPRKAKTLRRETAPSTTTATTRPQPLQAIRSIP